MKNKIIFISVITAILLCFATLSAILIQKTSNNGSEGISFYWDGVEYTVEEGTTFSEFVRSTDLQYEGKPYEICPDTGYITYTAHKCSLYMSVDPAGKIKAGEHYGADALMVFTYDNALYDFHNGSTWKSYLGIMYLEHDLENFIDVNIVNNNINLVSNSSYWICYEIHRGEVSGDYVKATDFIVSNYEYTYCK